MKYWTISGLGYQDYDPIHGTHRGWTHTTYIIKAADIEAAYKLFDKHIGHNSFEGFAEFAHPFDAAEVDMFYVAEEGECIWRTNTARAGGRLRLS